MHYQIKTLRYMSYSNHVLSRMPELSIVKFKILLTIIVAVVHDNKGFSKQTISSRRIYNKPRGTGSKELALDCKISLNSK